MGDAITIRVDNRLRVDRRGLPDGLDVELVAAFTHPNPELAKKCAMGFYTGGIPATLTTAVVERSEISLPRGGTGRVRQVLADRGLRARFVDQRLYLPPVDFPELRLTLRPYQAEAVAAMAQRENCLLRAPTGSGKSVAAMGLIAMLRQPTLVVLWSSNLMRQWREWVVRDFGMRERDIGLIRGSTMRVRPLTLAMQQTLWTRGVVESIRDSFGLVLCDEVQRFASRTCRDVIDAFPARYRFGISADETRKDRLDWITTDMFGSPAADIPMAELIDNGTIHDVEVRVVPTDFRADWYGANGPMSFDFNRLLAEMTSDEDRNALIAGIALEEARVGEPVLVFTHRVEHARVLADEVFAAEMPCGLLIGGAENSVRFEEDRSALLGGKLRMAVGTVQAIGQGLDLPSVSRGVVATPIAGNKQMFGQVRGRVCRRAEGKDDAVLYYLLDRAIYGRHLRNLVAWNRTVVVLDGGEWRDARECLGELERRWAEEARARQRQPDAGLFDGG